MFVFLVPGWLRAGNQNDDDDDNTSNNKAFFFNGFNVGNVLLIWQIGLE
jgi:hypothetical protein